MRRLREVLGRVTGMLLPWPSRRERRAAIDAATQEKVQSQATAAHAATIERDIRRMMEANHFAEVIAEQIIRGRR